MVSYRKWLRRLNYKSLPVWYCLILIFCISLYLTRNYSCSSTNVQYNEIDLRKLSADKKLWLPLEQYQFTGLKSAKGFVTYSELEVGVYRLFQLKVKVPKSYLPSLKHDTDYPETTCKQIFFEADIVSKDTSVYEEYMPSRFTDEFSMFGFVNCTRNFVKPDTSDIIWHRQDLLNSASSQTYTPVEKVFLKILNDYQIFNTKILMIGSERPWIERFAVRRGASEVTTVHHQDILSDRTEGVKYLGQYHLAISFATVYHRGLGRSGEAVNPNSDVREMREIKCLLKEDGLLLLAVPVGNDLTIYNYGRIYGRIRLPILLAGFEILDTFHSNGTRIQLKTQELEKKFEVNSDDLSELLVIFVLKHVTSFYPLSSSNRFSVNNN